MSSFSLKHRLINDEIIRKVAQNILIHHPSFALEYWVSESMQARENMSLLATLEYMAKLLHKYLGDESRSQQLPDLLKSLPDALDGDRSDGEFGEFIYSIYGYFVIDLFIDEGAAALTMSYASIEEITKRFSMEFAYRSLLSSEKKASLEQAKIWMHHPHAHVRRLASEGTRPTLPWGKKYTYTLGDTDDILIKLWHDPCDHVARSVANHLNDIAKVSSTYALNLLASIAQTARDTHQKRWEYLLHHGLRSLIRSNDQQALTLLGYKQEVGILHVSLDQNTKKQLDDTLSFEWTVSTTQKQPQEIIIECLWRFPGKKEMRSKKLRIYRGIISPDSPISKAYHLPLITRSTRLLLPGLHSWTWYLNGVEQTYQEQCIQSPNSDQYADKIRDDTPY